jgi:hypothetical protein
MPAWSSKDKAARYRGVVIVAPPILLGHKVLFS